MSYKDSNHSSIVKGRIIDIGERNWEELVLDMATKAYSSLLRNGGSGLSGRELEEYSKVVALEAVRMATRAVNNLQAKVRK